MIMKKYTSIIALCMVIVLLIPSAHVYASEFEYRFLTSESIDDYWDDETYDNIQSRIVRQSSTKIQSDLTYFQTYQNQINTFISDYDDYLVFYHGNGDTSNSLTNDFIIFGCPADVVCVYYYTTINSTRWINNYCFLSDHAFRVYYNTFGQNYSFDTQNLGYKDASLNTDYYIAWVGVPNMCQSVVTGGVPVYSFGAYADPFGQKLKDVWDNQDSLTNYNSNQLPFDDGSGNIVSPSSVSFSDTAYNGGVSFDYQQTHLYTEYNNAQGANETCVFKWALDSRSQSITQTVNDWKMHYYVVVNWHWTQATDSSVYTPLLSGGSGGQIAFEFDDTPEFIMQGKTQISIWDLVQNVPTVSSVSDEDIVSFAVAVSCLNGNIVNSVWKDIFGQSGQYVGDVASEIITGGKLEVQGVGEFGGSFINNLFNPAYYYALDDLRINLVAHPWSETLAIHGGNGDFDLNLCTNESYGTTQGYVDDGGTPNDPSDDTHYPTNNVPTQNNVVVPVTYPTSGGNVTVYSVVQVPDGGGGGNSINYSPSFSPSIVMDSGLDDLKETVDAYPQVPNQHFWDYFLVFKDNAFLDATSDFFGALPNELSSLLISSIGIIGVFAIYRFVRRR